MKKKFYAPGELAALYGVSLKTLNKWLKPHRDKIGSRPVGTYFYNVKQVKIIFDAIGDPFDEIEI
jgi:hypothetical protein